MTMTETTNYMSRPGGAGERGPLAAEVSCFPHASLNRHPGYLKDLGYGDMMPFVVDVILFVM